MVQQRPKTTRSLAASENGSEGGSSKDCDQVYCVVLHVAEAINFMGRDASEPRDKIVMSAVLNTVDFNVEGTHSTAAETIVFNSNCIWECDLAGIKRIKTDHRPVKLTFTACRGGGGLERKTIGSLLLPLRGLPVLSSTGSQNAPHMKMTWHKLICTSSVLRSQKPEVLLVLAIIKKSILHTKDFDHLMQFQDHKAPPTPPLRSPGHSITASMLQSQANIYVQSLMQLGLLQVGNDPLIDCDIIEVVLQLKQLKNVNRLVKWLNHDKEPSSVVVMFDFVGNVTNIELKVNDSDSYAVNDVLGLRFKTSLRSMRLYFQRIFYLPFNMYMNGTAIANYRMDFNNLLPPDSHFTDRLDYSSNGSFAFNRIGRQDSARDPKPPLMEYSFSVEIKNIHSRQEQPEHEPVPSIASGVIRELPKNHKDTEAMSLSPGHHDIASVASLNVGAELSASEDSRDFSSALDDEYDVDALAGLSRTQNKRRKFTRLKGEEPNLDSEDELRLEKKISKLLASEKLNLMEKEEDPAQESKKVDIEEQSCTHQNQKYVSSFTEEMMNVRICRIAEEALSSKKLKKKHKESKESIGKSPQPILKAPKNAKLPLEEDEYENPSEVASLQQFELEEKRLAEENDLECTKRRRIKSGQSPENTKPAMEEHEVENFSDITSLPHFQREEKRVSEEDKLESTKRIRIKVASTEELPAPIDQELRKSKKASNVPLTSSSESISETKVRKKCVKKVSKTELREEISLPQDSSGKSRDPECPETSILREKTFDLTEESVDNDQSISEQKICSRDNLCRKAKTTKIVKKQGSSESFLETDLPDQVVQSRRKVKSKTLVPEHLEDTSISTQDSTGIAKTSKSDLALRARWVEVNKVQSAALEETELFLEETCQTELHEILYEDQLALGLAKPPKPKTKLRTVREADVNSQPQGDGLRKKKRNLTASDHVLHVEFKGSEEYISLSESLSKSEEVINPQIEKRKVRVVKKKKAKETIAIEEEPLVGLNESIEEEASKPIKRKVIRKKSSVIIKNKEQAKNVEPQEELVAVQSKKVIKKTKPVADKPSEDDVKATKKVSSRNSVKATSSRKTLRDLTFLDDLDMDQSANTETVGQRIRSWRRQQIAQFEEELARKELHYKTQLEEMEYQELQQSQKGPDEVEIQANENVDYEVKFNELEQHISQLQAEMEQQVMLFESRSVELREENQQLANEKAELKARIATMELEITELRTQGSDEADLKEVLGELKTQNSRYFNLAREKDRYKKQWRRCARRVHALKLAMYEKTAESHLEGNTIDLREILTKDALTFEQEYGQFRRSGTTFELPFTSPPDTGDAPDMCNLSISQSLSQSLSQSPSPSLSQSIFQCSSQSSSQTISETN